MVRVFIWIGIGLVVAGLVAFVLFGPLLQCGSNYQLQAPTCQAGTGLHFGFGMLILGAALVAAAIMGPRVRRQVAAKRASSDEQARRPSVRAD